jgi:hypothetical protein
MRLDGSAAAHLKVAHAGLDRRHERVALVEIAQEGVQRRAHALHLARKRVSVRTQHERTTQLVQATVRALVEVRKGARSTWHVNA